MAETQPAETQSTIFGTHEPVAPHCSDIVVCSDGSECPRFDAFMDVEGCFHRTDEERFDANVLLVTDALNDEDKWCEEYCDSEDYATGYDHIVKELSHEWDDIVVQWVRDNWDELFEDDDSLGYSDTELSAAICDKLDEWDWEPIRNKSDYSGYSGDGCCLWSVKIGEYETQIDIPDCPVLASLHESGELDDVLDHVNADLYISRQRRREKNEETGYYEYVGRETYMPYPHYADHPHLLGYASISGGWDFVVPAERMTELVYEILDERAEDCA